MLIAYIITHVKIGNASKKEKLQKKFGVIAILEDIKIFFTS